MRIPSQLRWLCRSAANSRAVLLYVTIDIEFSLQACKIHVSDFAEDGTFAPRTVVNTADAPGDTGIAVWIAPVKRVAVIKKNCCFYCCFGVR